MEYTCCPLLHSPYLYLVDLETKKVLACLCVKKERGGRREFKKVLTCLVSTCYFEHNVHATRFLSMYMLSRVHF